MDEITKSNILGKISELREYVESIPTDSPNASTEEPDPVEPDPVEPDPVEPDPVEPDPVEPDPVEPEPQPVAVPTGLAATIVEPDRIQLSWDDSDADAWRIRESADPNKVLAEVTSVGSVRGPLKTGQTYNYTLTAVLGGVESARASFPSVNLPAPVQPEPDPTNPDPEPPTGDVSVGFRTATHGGITPVHPKAVRAKRAGITFASRSGFTASTNGAVYENLRITGVVTVNADDVTFRNCEFYGTSGPDGLIIRNNGARLRIEGSLIDGQGRGHAIGYSSYTMEYCEVRNCAEGPRLNGNAVVRYSWIHHLKQVGTNHTDTLQSLGGSGNRIIGNFVELYNPASSNPFGNACVQFGTEAKAMPDLHIIGNYFDGGNYSINGGGGGSRDSCGRIWGNRFGPANHTRYGGMMIHVERACIDKQDNRRANSGEFAYTV